MSPVAETRSRPRPYRAIKVQDKPYYLFAKRIIDIAGAIAGAFYKEIHVKILSEIYARLPDTLTNVTMRFVDKFCRY